VLSRRIVDLALGTGSEAVFPSERAELDAVIGTYRPIDMVDPETPFLHLLLNVQVALGDDGAQMRVPMLRETASLRPLGPGRFRVEGGLFDGATALFENDRLYAHWMVARRVAPWETANAFFAYAGIVLVGVASVPALLVWRRIQRHRRTLAPR
jgi:hypothetical protein